MYGALKYYAVIMVLCDSALTFWQDMERSARRIRLFALTNTKGKY